jgi:hypothetical protein
MSTGRGTRAALLISAWSLTNAGERPTGPSRSVVSIGLFRGSATEERDQSGEGADQLAPRTRIERERRARVEHDGLFAP